MVIGYYSCDEMRTPVDRPNCGGIHIGYWLLVIDYEMHTAGSCNTKIWFLFLVKQQPPLCRTAKYPITNNQYPVTNGSPQND
jgi:hypothetical protein